MAGRERRVAGVVAAGVIALIAPGTALADRAESEISMSTKVPAFHGKVASPDGDCRRNRSVQLYRKVVGAGKRRIGRTTSTGNGRWAIPVDDIESGAYFAKAKGDESCRSAKSKTVVID